MKFFHLSDLHIGKQLHGFSLAEDQEHILNEVIQKAQELHPDALLIAGDIYDKGVPSAEAVALFDGFLSCLTKRCPKLSVLIVSGNHDSPKRLAFAESILQRENIHIAGMPPQTERERIRRVILSDEYGETEFWLLPFLKPGYLRKAFPEETIESYEQALSLLLARESAGDGRRRVLVSHQFYTAAGRAPERCDSEAVTVGGLDNIDTSLLEPFTYAALGHIHRPQQIGKPQFRYCGTLLPYSVSECGDKKTLTVVTLEAPGTEPKIEQLLLHPLRNIQSLRGTLDELLARETVCEDYVSLTLTDDLVPYRPRERLEEKYARILELRIDNASTRSELSEREEEEILTDPLALFQQFYQGVQGRALSSEEEALVRQILEREEECECGRYC